MITITEKKYSNWFKDYYITRGLPIQEINIFSIRNEEKQADNFMNDLIGIWDSISEIIYIMVGTTDPGKYWTESGGAGKYRKGVAHMCYGFHEKIWCVDKHQGKYRALCNRAIKGCKKVRFWRDANKDFKKDFGEKVEYGWIGLNLHRANKWIKSILVGKWSAGCQVVSDPIDFDKLIQIICASDMYRNTKIPTLFNYNIFAINEAPIELYNNLFKK